MDDFNDYEPFEEPDYDTFEKNQLDADADWDVYDDAGDWEPDDEHVMWETFDLE